MEEKKIITGIYARVSVDDEKDEGTLETQIKEARDYSRDKGYEINEDYVLAEKMTGTTIDRPELNKLKEATARGEINMIVALVPDRLFRPKENDSYKYLELLANIKKNGADVDFVKSDRIGGDVGSLVDHLMTISAGQERKQFLERTERAKTKLAINSEAPQGTGIGCYGYIYEDKKLDKKTGKLLSGGKRIINPEQSPIVKRIFEETASGKSRHKITESLNAENIPSFKGGKWNPRVMTHMIQNESYIGKSIFRKTKRISKTKVIIRPKEEWIIMDDFSPRIVSDELFERANMMLKSRQTYRVDRKYLLSGIIFCENCNSKMVGASMQKGRFLYYRCPNNAKPKGSPDRCDTTNIRIEKVEPIIKNQVLEIMKHPKAIMEHLANNQKSMMPDIENRIDQLKQALKSKMDEKKRLIQLTIKGHITQADESEQFDILEKEITRIKVDLAEIESKNRVVADTMTAGAQIEDWMIDFQKVMSEQYLNDELIRRILFGLQIKVLVGEKDVETGNQFDTKPKKKKDIKVFGLFPYSDTNITNFTQSASINYATTGQTSGCLSCQSIINPNSTEKNNITSCKNPVEHIGIEAFEKAIQKIDDDYYHRIFNADENYLDKGYLFGWKYSLNHKGTIKHLVSFTEAINKGAHTVTS